MKINIINRPILAIVISLIILFLGILSLFELPMALFPSVAPPEVNVEVEYQGANAETVAKSAIEPLERAINGVPNMKYMSSNIGSDGVGIVQVIFETGTDINDAAVNVQNRITDIMGELPPEVIQRGVLIGKETNAILMYINIFSDDPEMTEKFIHNFADLNILTELKRVRGVGYANILGAKEYAMRIWLRPDKMLAYNISTDDVIEALQEHNLEASPGKVGENSDRTENSDLQYILSYTGRFNTEEQYANIPIKASEEGKILRIEDVAEIEFGTEYFDVEAKFNGKPAASIILKQLPGTNAREVIENVKQRMEELKETMFLEGMDYEVSYDTSRFMDASIKEVIKTFIEALLLVTLVVFVFLQNWRATLIPALAVPVSIVGTFFFMQFFGFSLNLITLFALVIVIGIVVDDSIVVVEAVHAKMERYGLNAKQATQAAMKEISGAILAITLVMSAVFVPVAFMSGPAGIFFRQFSLTMAIAIVLSGIVALTLAPALCSLLLKHPELDNNSFFGKFFSKFNAIYENLEGKYQNILNRIINRRVMTWSILIAFVIGSGIFGKVLRSGFIPNEDQGMFYINVLTPSGSTLERTKAVVGEIEKEIQDVKEIESISSLAGTNILSDGTGATYGSFLINLKEWGERKASVMGIIERLKEKTAHIKGAEIEFFPPPAVPGYGNASGFEVKLLNKTGNNDLQAMEAVTQQFVEDLNKRPEIGNCFTLFNANIPHYTLHVDYDKAAQKGVTVNNAMNTLSTLVGSEYASNFIKFGRTYKVMVQALPEYREKPEDILNYRVKNDRGEMVPLSTFITLEKSFGVDQINRHNMYFAAALNGEEAPGYSSGDALKAIQEVAKEKLPRGYDIAWAGISYDEVNAGNKGILIFFICLLFVFLILSGQYESFLLPLPVILSLPTGMFGAFFTLSIFGLENNIYSQIAMVMLIGLLGKNAILIVEFANQKRSEGKSALQAAIEGARLRLRPILMTSFAFMAGLLPLVLASGAGAIGNKTIGSAALGGMLFGTLFGVVIIPGLYLVFAKISEKFIRNEKSQKTFTETLNH
ncbi:MAG: hydrophobe/amphiphile efflux-1 family RND transporter [Muricauda sp.]|nr:MULTISPECIES: efflux RND transporter permease subunit [unclassified Allomuricauda]MAU15187.1 hydrophobe/amphiphile efflux-1 family RND transporter [Allomuricauda sp.]